MSPSIGLSEAWFDDDGQVTADDFYDPDMELIEELLEHIDRKPPAQQAHKMLMEQYIRCGWVEAAEQHAREILKVDPHNTESLHSLGKLEKIRTRKSRSEVKGKDKADQRMEIGEAGPHWARMKGKTSGTAAEPGIGAWRPSLSPISSPESSLQELEEGYVALLEKARALQKETELLKNLKGMRPLIGDKHIVDLTALVQGRISSVLKGESLDSAKDVVETMMAKLDDDWNGGLVILIKDLQNVVQYWSNSRKNPRASPPSHDGDDIRTILIKRVRALKGLLPVNFGETVDNALMHVEHEVLCRKYTNDETMYGDAVVDIPREKFWASEDGYAWDMDELTQAITSGGGVMRNPLSKELFTATDVRSIMRHPEGKRLQALQVNQSELKKGVRPTTVDKMAKLANVLDKDMTENQLPSRRSVEEFLSYVATLPSGEQKAIDELKVPAKDSHTGINFDIAIGDAVRDAQNNKVCFHKTGDLLRQAAEYLRK